MKRLLVYLSLFMATRTAGQISIISGDWNDPATWDCNCVPTGSATVNHHVRLTQDETLSGTLTIGPAGTVDGFYFPLFVWNGLQVGSLEDQGALEVGALTIGGGVSHTDGFTLHGGMTIYADSLVNTGYVLVSMGPAVLLSGTFVNKGYSYINGLENEAEILNEGFFWVYVYTGFGDIHSTGTMDLIDGTIDGTVVIDLGGELNSQHQVVNGVLELRTDSSMDRLTPMGEGLPSGLTNNGVIKGAGGVCVTNIAYMPTHNYGEVLDSVDVCNLDSIGIVFSDTFTVNTGYIASTVTGCMNPLCGMLSTAIAEQHDRMEVSVYPNPSDGNFLVEMGGRPIDGFVLRNAIGAIVLQRVCPSVASLEIEVIADPGLYLLEVRSDQGVARRSVVIQ